MGKKKKISTDTFTRILEITKDSKFLIDDSSATDLELEDAAFNLSHLLRKERLDIRSAMTKGMYLSSFIQEVVKSFEIEHGTNIPELHFGHNTGRVKKTFEDIYLPSIKWWFSAKEICKYIIIPYTNFLYRKDRKITLYKLMDRWIMDGLFALKP